MIDLGTIAMVLFAFGIAQAIQEEKRNRRGF